MSVSRFQNTEYVTLNRTRAGGSFPPGLVDVPQKNTEAGSHHIFSKSFLSRQVEVEPHPHINDTNTFMRVCVRKWSACILIHILVYSCEISWHTQCKDKCNFPLATPFTPMPSCRKLTHIFTGD